MLLQPSWAFILHFFVLDGKLHLISLLKDSLIFHALFAESNAFV